GRARRRLGPRPLSRAGGRSLAHLLSPAHGQGRADTVSARPLAHPCQAPPGGGQEDRPLRGSHRHHVAQAGALLDAQRQSSPCGAGKAQVQAGAGHPVPEPEVAFQILALNTEKAHNLKEKSLEVIRMYRGLVDDEPESGEEGYAFQFEAPHFITLGLLYEKNKRFAGGAFAPILRRVDKFLKGRFPKTLGEREERAEL